MYRINIEYSTGDSFNTYDESRELEYSWSDLNRCKESLARIKEHNAWILDWSRLGEQKKALPEFVEKHFGNPIKKYSKYHIQILFEAEYYLYLINDQGEDFKVCAFWTGYFENLHSASIVADNKDGWSFTV